MNDLLKLGKQIHMVYAHFDFDTKVTFITHSNVIRFALDLYRNKLLEVDLAFTNPFRKV
jgi:hypothetical protein